MIQSIMFKAGLALGLILGAVLIVASTLFAIPL